ncbi:MAG: hypothetical protein JW717_11375 [Marinilabiliaceae bacterium]|nr:hypothetical protein [Marinilabiliaceae bacterium]
MSYFNLVIVSHGVVGIWGSNFETYPLNHLVYHSSLNSRITSGYGYTNNL